MKLTMRRFLAILRLIDAMREEAQRNAQGDNGADVERRRENYRRKLEALLSR
jgi:aminoglycoside phosphotransferase (APT) family kinase protein